MTAGQLSEREVSVYLKEECILAGGQDKWAANHKVSAQYVSDVIRRRRQPGTSILVALGLRKVVTYERK